MGNLVGVLEVLWGYSISRSNLLDVLEQAQKAALKRLDAVACCRIPDPLYLRQERLWRGHFRSDQIVTSLIRARY